MFSRIFIKVVIIVKFDTNNHSVFLLYYHLVLVVKYRRKVIDYTASNYLRDIFERIGSNYNITVEEWNCCQDHVHIVFKAHPNSKLSTFLNAYKSASSRLIKKRYPHIRQGLWKGCFWSTSYCLLSTGTVSTTAINSYIEQQSEKPKCK